MGRPAAVLWDMDGTLVDTEPYWMATEVALAEEYGATWTTEDAYQLVGNSLLRSGEYIRERMGIPLTPEQIVERLLDGVVARVQHAVPWCPGARELLLERAAIDAAPPVRIAAIESVGPPRSDAERTAMTRIAGSDPAPEVRQIAHAALDAGSDDVTGRRGA